MKWTVPGTLFQTFNNFKWSLIIVTSTLKAILTTIFILNLIISKDFLKNYKSNGEKIKPSEKIWSKQLLATNMKIEENRRESTSHVVKVKDRMICQIGIRIHGNQTQGFVAEIKSERSFNPSLVTFYWYRSWSNHGEIQYFKCRVQRTISNQLKNKIKECRVMVSSI